MNANMRTEILAERAATLTRWGVKVTPEIFEQMGESIDAAYDVLTAEAVSA